MITDKIENIDIYNNITKDVRDFIKALKSSIELGRYELGNGDYANIEAYTTKSIEDAKYEAHCKYIDIQILLSGKEKIYYCSKENLVENVPYNKEKDIVFYNREVGGNYIELDGSNFMVIYPHEAHAPQVQARGVAEDVVKVVVKVKV